ncbi:acyl carrier protein [Mucilaginibacter boryungensis]|uniref:Acyl carrier protein n=1 Tax=Mucilaginibacter boryungensis TaxID=768480 RepID=A0ABR9XF97_9SPHI|nr:acyl carrier protein [Mucilaginibacter boryungensis]MBE9665840.1 acyl carrier protein [Mucilaginibacter boryungensis]
MINKDFFLNGLKEQFEEGDADSLTFDTEFESLDTWDSLTRFSIIAFINDDYQIIIGPDDFKKLKTPQEIFDYISIELNNT